MKLVTVAATFLLVLGACTRSPDPKRLSADKEPEHRDDTPLCERYARAAELVIEDWYSDPVEFLNGVDGPTGTPRETAAPRWTVRWSCADSELLLKARLPEDDVLLIVGGVAQVRLDDLVHGLRREGMDPRADKQSIVVEVADTGDTARFDPRQPPPRYPPR